MSNLYDSDVIWLDSPGNISIKCEQLLPPLSKEIICKTIVTAISTGSEISHFLGFPPLVPGKSNFPRKLGYCNVSEVKVVGKDVNSVQKGDRVLSFATHRSSFLLKERDIKYILPKHSNSDLISTSYLYHLGYDAVLKSGIKLGSKVLVIGLGLLGLTSVCMAKLAGGIVTAISNNKSARDVAIQNGAIGTYDRDEILKKNIKEASNFDVIVITTNKWIDLQIALKSASQKGNISMLGHLGRGEEKINFNPFSSQYFQTKQLSINAVGLSPEFPDDRGFLRFNEIDNLKFIASLINERKIKPETIISGSYFYKDIAKAYDNIFTRKGSPITFLIKWQE